jgi:hypothetical protein
MPFYSNPVSGLAQYRGPVQRRDAFEGPRRASSVPAMIPTAVQRGRGAPMAGPLMRMDQLSNRVQLSRESLNGSPDPLCMAMARAFDSARARNEFVAMQRARCEGRDLYMMYRGASDVTAFFSALNGLFMQAGSLAPDRQTVNWDSSVPVSSPIGADDVTRLEGISDPTEQARQAMGLLDERLGLSPDMRKLLADLPPKNRAKMALDLVRSVADGGLDSPISAAELDLLGTIKDPCEQAKQAVDLLRNAGALSPEQDALLERTRNPDTKAQLALALVQRVVDGD